MPSLRRIILIDTHLPGVVELKLDGHTNICGTNASGKTTLQRLIPVFYGEYPSRVVPATRDSFERWYLPRQSSFIIYEYERGDTTSEVDEAQLCQVVLSSNGNGVNYRFIAKAFELSDYLIETQAGQHTSVGINELVRTHKRNNVFATNLLNTKEFRAIIQNDRSILNSSSNSRELLGYARLFSLSEQAESLRHIEKLAKAVHSKEGKMETIKAMIAAILEEDGVQPPSSSLNPNRVEDWIRECGLIKEFDSIRPEFAKLEQADHSLHQTEHRLAELKQQYQLDANHLSHIIEQSQAQLDEAGIELKHQEQQWYQLRDQLNQELSAAKADIDKFEADLDQVEQEFDHWQQQDIENLQANLQKLPSWHSELDIAQTRYNLLTEKHQDVESAFNKRLADLEEKLNISLEKYNQLKHQLQEKRSEQKQQEQHELNRIKQEHQVEKNQLEQNHQQQLSELKIAQAELNASVKNAGFNEFEQSQLEMLDASIEEATLSEDSLREQLYRRQHDFKQANSAQKDAAAELEKIRQSSQGQERVIKQIEALLYPGDGTLLEFLHEHKAGWEQSLGKVVNPALLNRQDLKPSVADNQNSLFGLTLDLAAIDSPEYAQSEQALQTKLADAQDKLSRLVEQQNEAEQSLTKASEQVRNLELAVAKAEGECRLAETNRKRVQQEKSQLQQEYQQALAQRKLEAKKRLDKNQQQQKQLTNQQQLALTELADQFREAETEQQFHWQQLIGDTEAELSQVDSQISDAKKTAEQDKIACQRWLENELNQRGVDVDEIGQLKKQIKQLKTDIDFTETNRNKVNDYQHWYKTVFTSHKLNWQKSLESAKKQASQASRQLEQQGLAFNQQKAQLLQTKTSCEQTLTQSKNQEQELQSVVKGLNKLHLPKLDLTNELGFEAVNIAQRISEGLSKLQSREQLLTDIRVYVEHFDALIAAQAGTGLSDTWERSREECATINSQGIKTVDHRRLVSHLAQLLNVIVPQKLQGLKEQGRIFGADLAQYYNVLEDIDKRIGNQSKRISKEVGEELFLDGVSDSAVKIRSRISELEFWPALAEFRSLYEQWMQTGASELPEDDYAQSMRRVLNILGRAALSGGISKLLDIELHLKEGNSDLIIRTDRQLNESSSHGMAYLILCKFLLAFTRLLRGSANATIHWPIDELGTLHQSNIKKIFDACQNNNISVVGAFPNPESEVLTLFDNRYLIDKATRKLQVIQPKVSAISERIKARLSHENQAQENQAQEHHSQAIQPESDASQQEQQA